MLVPPPVLVILAKAPIVDEFDLSHVLTINSGGAAMYVFCLPYSQLLVVNIRHSIDYKRSKELAAQVGQRLRVPVTAISHNYGSTEMTSGGIWHGLAPVKQGSCGLILPNSEVRLIDPDTDKEVDGPNQPVSVS